MCVSWLRYDKGHRYISIKLQTNCVQCIYVIYSQFLLSRPQRIETGGGGGG